MWVPLTCEKPEVDTEVLEDEGWWWEAEDKEQLGLDLVWVGLTDLFWPMIKVNFGLLDESGMPMGRTSEVEEDADAEEDVWDRPEPNLVAPQKLLLGLEPPWYSFEELIPFMYDEFFKVHKEWKGEEKQQT